MLFSATKVLGHPHVFIDKKTNCIFDDNGFKGFWVEWVFGDMYKPSRPGKHDLYFFFVVISFLNSIRSRDQSPTPDIFQDAPGS